MRRVIRRRWPASLLIILLAVCGCSADTPPSGNGSEHDVGLGNGILVERRTITSVLVVGGAVMASPRLVIAAPATGKVQFRSEDPFEARRDEVIGDVGGTPVRAPVDGTVIPEENAREVETNLPIGQVVYRGFAVEVVVPPDQLYRLYGREPVTGTAAISAGPAGVDCELFAASAGADESEPGRIVEGSPGVCVLPGGTDVVEGLPARVGVAVAERADVLAVPVTAVLGAVHTGQVTVVREDGTTEVRTVQLGLSDGSFVEIIDGLDEGDSILSFAPLPSA